ncbi:MAG: radical SAM protein [Clostridia bacterium]|nr:radical SAM protein [Clostridia bacterium]
MHQPSYKKLHETGELKNRARALKERLECCVVCPHHCKVNRLKNERGFCRAGGAMVIDSYGAHFGEEETLVGLGGSGTIFFSYCTLQCVFCQNCEISHLGEGYEVSPEKLAAIMLSLQKLGCHNINLVSPTHYAPQIVEAIDHASESGLEIPIVYNTGGYEELDTLRLLEGVVDIYMPDIKFGDNDRAKKYTKSARYFDVVKEAVREMYRQVGDLKTGDNNIAYRGLLVRHLVMPNNLANTERIMEFIASEISKNTTVNIMAQYFPAHKALSFEEMSRRITSQEYRNAVKSAKTMGLERLITS